MNVPKVDIKQLLEAGVHLGHKTLRWNPKMKQYIFGEKNSIHIIDLSFCSVKTNDSDSLILSLLLTKMSENKNNSNSPLLSLNLTIAKGVPLALFFSCIDIIVPATRASLSLLFKNSL